jgi:hypothetical protein
MEGPDSPFNTALRLAFDADTSRLVRVSGGCLPHGVQLDLSDYKTFDGLTIWTKIAATTKNELGETISNPLLTVREIEFLETIDDAVFEPPMAKEKD